MLDSLMNLVKQFLEAFIWASVIQPWEQAVKTRLGRNPQVWGPGFHWKIPYADSIFRQTIRRRNSNFGPQTVTTSDGVSLTICGTVAYSIRDLLELYDRLHHPQDAITSTAQAAIADFVAAHPLAECTPAAIAAACKADLGLRKFGILVHDVSLTTFARVRAYRLITDVQDPSWTWGDILDTNKKDGAPSAD